MMLDLKMEVYTPALELIGFLEVHRSVIWSEKAFSAGSFSVESLITPDALAMLQPENIVWIEGDTAGIIEYVQEEADKNGPYITVKGRTLTGILDRRVLWGLYGVRGTAPEIMHALVNECCINPTRGDVESRKIPGLVSRETPAGGDTIQYQATGGALLGRLEALGETYGVAFGVRFNPAIPLMEFWTRWGQNRSIHQSANNPVLYSTELDDVLSSEYTYNSQDYRNVALVGGEGEGGDRVYVTVNGDDETPTPPTPPEPPEPTMYTVTLDVDPDGGGTASGGKTVAAGESITVTATPSDGFEFVEWQENSVSISKNRVYTFTVTKDRKLTAVFAASVPVYTITATVDPAGSGKVTGTGQYRDGALVALNATANDGYSFTAWQEGGATVHSAEDYSFTAEKNRDLVAAFKENKPSRLPEGYTEVEYIQSDGNQYIDTGRKPTSTLKLSVDVEPTDAGATSQKFIAASYYVPSSGTKYILNVLWASAGVQISSGSFSSTYSYKTISSNAEPRRMTVVVDYPNKIASVKGEAEISLSNVSTSASMLTLKLLTGASGASANILSAKLYSAIMEDSSQKSEWIPCTNPDGEAGLYDIVGGAFYGNAGTGAFTAGPAV